MLTLISILVSIMLSIKIFLEWMRFLLGLLRDVDITLIQDLRLALMLAEPYIKRRMNRQQIQNAPEDLMRGIGQHMGRGKNNQNRYENVETVF